MEKEAKISGGLIVKRGFSLVEHLISLNVGQECFVMTTDFGLPTIYVTTSRLKKKGYLFTVKAIRRGKQPVERVKVTRLN